MDGSGGKGNSCCNKRAYEKINGGQSTTGRTCTKLLRGCWNYINTQQRAGMEASARRFRATDGA